jgi:hypothetical protein
MIRELERFKQPGTYYLDLDTLTVRGCYGKDHVFKPTPLGTIADITHSGLDLIAQKSAEHPHLAMLGTVEDPARLVYVLRSYPAALRIGVLLPGPDQVSMGRLFRILTEDRPGLGREPATPHDRFETFCVEEGEAIALHSFVEGLLWLRAEDISKEQAMNFQCAPLKRIVEWQRDWYYRVLQEESS